ncbi:MAG TPA: hypothetical protein VKR56_11085 [Candidatus Cybelea sp.]|nr:hypothetical protein [Candidatus Cybelea sp.]
MRLKINRSILLAGLMALATSACGGNGAVPSNTGAAAARAASANAAPADTTSILKLLTKNVTIGSTVDPANGDQGPRAISVVQSSSGKLKKNQVLVCNFEDSSGNAGNGTTIEQLAPVTSSKPATFIQNSKIEGCDGDAVTGADADDVFATGMTSKAMVEINSKGKLKKSFGSPITEPIGDGAAPPLYDYSPEIMFIGNADTGAVDNIGVGYNGNNKLLEVINGFPVNKGSGWSALGPSGLSYWCGVPKGSYTCGNKADVLYIADGACNAVVAISHASTLLIKDEITIEPGCKKFSCKYRTDTCATLVKAGSPLDNPVAMTLLPNGNLIVANTGNNMLVEMTPKGKVLDTLVVDTGQAPAVFGLAAIGTKDSNTALFYTDTNTNTLQELEQ